MKDGISRFATKLLKTLAPWRLLIVAVVVLGVPLAGAALRLDWGTLCSYCPVGLAQVSAASRSIHPLLLYSVLALAVIAFFLGRFLCSWLCPTNLIPWKRHSMLKGRGVAETPRSPHGDSGENSAVRRQPLPHGARRDSPGIAFSTVPRVAITVGVVVVASFIAGFPVFCFFCPIGLFFGFVYALVKTFTAYTPSWDLVVFPVMLLLEFKLFKRWCGLVCPIGAFMSLVGKLSPARLTPVRRTAACRLKQGCSACERSCPSRIPVRDIGVENDEDCSLCAQCLRKCPHGALDRFGFSASRESVSPDDGAARAEGM